MDDAPDIILVGCADAIRQQNEALREAAALVSDAMAIPFKEAVLNLSKVIREAGISCSDLSLALQAFQDLDLDCSSFTMPDISKEKGKPKQHFKRQRYFGGYGSINKDVRLKTLHRQGRG